MDLVQTVRKEGSRGGRADFKWSDVAQDQHRENYLGHSLMAPVGRWQRNKDLQWYSRSKEDEADMTEAEKRKEELRKVKQAENDAMAKALGYEPMPLAADGEAGNPNETALGPKKRSHEHKEHDEGERRHRKRSRSRERGSRRHHHHHRDRDLDREDRSHHRRHRSRSQSRRRRSQSRERRRDGEDDRKLRHDRDRYSYDRDRRHRRSASPEEQYARRERRQSSRDGRYRSRSPGDREDLRHSRGHRR